MHQEASTITTRELISALENKRFRFSSEDDLQKGIAIALTQAGIEFEREKPLSDRDRPDFLIDASIAVEVKIKGTLAQALRQIARYTEHSQIESVLLVGSPFWLRDVPATLNGKPIYSMRLTSSLL